MASVVHELPGHYPRRLGRRAAVIATPVPRDLAAEEARLAQRAVAGDGDAFAELYGRYEKRAYNLCLRILGSEDDAADATQEAFVSVLRRLPKLEGRDLAFGSYLFTSARHACYDLIDRRKRAEPSDEIPESSIPVGGGVGGGGTGFDPGDPEDDPERNVLQQARSEEIRAANAALPERQREVLALRELEELSYDEIAEIMEMNRNSVAQLISRARINLRDALRGTALASIATSSPDCERAIALIAAGQDGQEEASDWLDDHVRDCETCRLSREAMEEAGLSYRAWLPVAAAPFLLRETLARAAESVDADWSEQIARLEAARVGGGAGSSLEGARASVVRHRRLGVVLTGALAALLLLVVLTARTHDGAPSVAQEPAAEEIPVAEAPDDEPGEPAEPAKTAKKKDGGGAGKAAGPVAVTPEDEDAAPSDGGEPAAADSPRADRGGSNDKRPSGDDNTGSVGRQPRGGGEGLAGDPPGPTEQPQSEPPVTTTPEPPVVIDPPAAGGCRDAQGNPIQCPPPPQTRCPTGCITLPPPTRPPR